MRVSWVRGLLFAGVIIAAASSAQDVYEDEIQWGYRPYAPEGSSALIRVQTNEVQVPVVVRDDHNQMVGQLQRADFHVFDNGKEQAITGFEVLNEAAGSANASVGSAGAPPTASPSPPQPLFVSLYFEDLNTTIPYMTYARDAAMKLVRKGLTPGEKMGIFTASGALSLDFTNDTQKLLDTLAKLRVYMRMPNSGICPPLATYQAWVIVHVPGRTPEYEAAIGGARACCGPGGENSCIHSAAEMVTSIAEGFARDTLDSLLDAVRYVGRKPGRRILVLCASGFLSHSLKHEQQRVVEAALQNKVVINSLDTAGLPIRLSSEHFNLSFPMSDIANGTGGEFFHNNNDLERGLHDLTTPPKYSYLLSFSPGAVKPDGSVHNLKVKLTSPTGLSVQARPSYVAPGGELSGPEKRYQKLEKQVMASGSLSDIPVQVTATPVVLANGNSDLQIAIHVDVRKLPFQAIGDRKVERLIIVAAVFDGQNHFLTGAQGVVNLRLKETTLAHLIESGVDAKLSLNIPQGTYRLRTVVQEAVDGHLSALSQAVEIH